MIGEALEEQKQGMGEQDEESVSFAHLKSLYEMLPDMEKLGENVALVRAAQAVVRADEELSARKAQLAEAEKRLRLARARAEEAEDNARKEEVDSLRREVVYAGSLVGFRVAPARNAEQAFEAALAASPFDGADQARTALVSPSEFDAMVERLERYQVDYKRTLALCQEFAS